jgi:hypothetical protein
MSATSILCRTGWPPGPRSNNVTRSAVNVFHRIGIVNHLRVAHDHREQHTSEPEAEIGNL